MRLGFFTMPMHPPHRNWVETLKEDRQSFILADKLGFYDAFCGEHIADIIENVTNSFQFLATLIHGNQDDQACHRHGQSVADPSGADRRPCGDVRSSVRRPFRSRRQRRRAAGRRRTARHAGRGPHAHFPRGAGRDPGAVDRRTPPYNFDQPDNRFKISSAKMGRREFGLGVVAQALSEAVSGNRRHCRRAEFERARHISARRACTRCRPTS